MSPQGMVHALEQIHRLLKSGGMLVDIHPIPVANRIEVYRGSERLFSKPGTGGSLDGYQQADQAITASVRQGLYKLEERREFDFVEYGSTVAELRQYLAEQDSYEGPAEVQASRERSEKTFAEADKVLRQAGEGAQVALHTRAAVTRLKPC